MYLPAHFRERDHNEICEFLDASPLAQLISMDENREPFLNPIPLFLENRQPSQLTFVGHMSKQNPQWRHFERNNTIYGSFLGPSAYISPIWYGNDHAEHVPTWNYLFVRFEGEVEPITSKDELISLLKIMSEHFEKQNHTNWRFDIPDDLQGDALAKAIIGFRIRVKKLEAKFKINQNRTRQEQQNVVKELAASRWQLPNLVDMMKKRF